MKSKTPLGEENPMKADKKDKEEDRPKGNYSMTTLKHLI
jgi:hypothetical protein